MSDQEIAERVARIEATLSIALDGLSGTNATLATIGKGANDAILILAARVAALEAQLAQLQRPHFVN